MPTHNTWQRHNFVWLLPCLFFAFRDVMKIKILLICILLVSCSRKSQRISDLEHIYAEGVNYPAMALHQLKEMPDTAEFSLPERALYILAISEAKLNQGILPDTLALAASQKYYENHLGSKNREKYARAVICRGRVEAAIRNAQCAVGCYRQVIEVLSDKGELNYGLANLYLAELYDMCNLRYGDIYRLCATALRSFERVGAKRYQAIALSELMCVSRLYNRAYSDSCWLLSSKIATELGDSMLCYENKELMAVCSALEGRPVEAKSLALDCIGPGRRYAGTGPYRALIMSYAMLGKVDSAQYWLDLTTPDEHYAYDRVLDAYALSCVAFAKGDLRQALELLSRSGQRIDSISESEEVRKAIDAELSNYDKVVDGSKSSKTELYVWPWVFVLAILLAFVVSRYRHKKRVRELYEAFRSQGKVDKQMLGSRYGKTPELARILDEHVALMNLLVDLCREESPEQFAVKFKNLVKVERGGNDSNLFWNTINDYVSSYYGKIVADVVDNSEEISARELKIVKLLCFGFSTADVAVLMRYGGPGSVRMAMSRLARKMHLADARALRDFIEERRDYCGSATDVG